MVFFLKDVLDSKNSAIKDLQYELARVCKVNISSFFLFSFTWVEDSRRCDQTKPLSINVFV